MNPPLSAGYCCPECGAPKSEVIDSRSRITYVRRRRQCIVCSARFSTVEIDARIPLRIRRIVNTLPTVKGQVEVDHPPVDWKKSELWKNPDAQEKPDTPEGPDVSGCVSP